MDEGGGVGGAGEEGAVLGLQGVLGVPLRSTIAPVEEKGYGPKVSSDQAMTAGICASTFRLATASAGSTAVYTGRPSAVVVRWMS